MEKKIKIGTWNVCLGLANKKDLVSKIIIENEIDVCVLQEVDIPLNNVNAFVYDENKPI